jgi:hypothetical protein
MKNRNRQWHYIFNVLHATGSNKRTSLLRLHFPNASEQPTHGRWLHLSYTWTTLTASKHSCSCTTKLDNDKNKKLWLTGSAVMMIKCNLWPVTSFHDNSVVSYIFTSPFPKVVYVMSPSSLLLKDSILNQQIHSWDTKRNIMLSQHKLTQPPPSIRHPFFVNY